jgi:vitamin B12 transporter
MIHRALHVSFLISLLTPFAHANSDLDNLLNIYATKSDLSKKTKKENSGNLILFTRKDLEIMQAKTLVDVLKSNPFIRYRVSRYNVPDPLNNGESSPVNSNNIRIFIDEQEMTSASYGSGFPLIGDIDLGFVDHIEIYSFAPSFEYTTERRIFATMELFF